MPSFIYFRFVIFCVFSEAPPSSPAASAPSRPAENSSEINAESGERMSDAERHFRDRHHISGEDPSDAERSSDREVNWPL